MARHARDLDAVLEVSALWRRLKFGDDVFIFSVGDTVYTIRGIDSLDARYIVDSQSSLEFKENGARVRYILDKNLDIYEAKYILATSLLNVRCTICSGVDVVFCTSIRGDICQDCKQLQ